MTSIKDIARRAGVSVTTVSRVINNSSHSVGAATRSRVLQAAEELGFRPNILAQAMVSQRMRIVGVIVGDSSDPYFSAIVRGIEHTARAHGYMVLICNSDRDPAIERNYLKVLCDYRVAGTVFAGGSREDAQYRQECNAELDVLREAGVALVALNPHICVENEVQIDNEAAAREMTEYLLGLGHRRIAYVDGPPGITTSRLRLRGYRRALEAAGISFDRLLVWPGTFNFESGIAVAGRYLAAQDKPTAIFASNDQTAVGTVAGLSQAAVRVPQGVSVAGFDDIQAARYATPSLTTIGVPMYQLGVEGMKKVLSLLEDGGELSPVTYLPHELIIRESTCPPAVTAASLVNKKDAT
jgi:LacI family transcriptional regulator